MWNFFRRYPAQLIVNITRRPRAFPKFDWDKHWVNNCFRVFEAIFGKEVEDYDEERHGYPFSIKREHLEAKKIVGGVVVAQTNYSFTLENALSVIEGKIRNYLRTWQWEPVRVLVPVLQERGDFPIFTPYSFVLAFDAENQSTSGASPRTQAHTVSGADTYMNFGVVSSGVFTDNSTAASCNGVGGTKRVSQNDTGSGIGNALAMWTLADPTTGTVSVSSSSGNIFSFSASYSGANDYDANDPTRTTSSPTDSTITTVADNCWLGVVGTDGGSNPSVSGVTTQRGTTSGAALYGDSAAAKTPAGGTYSIGITYTGAADGLTAGVSFSPAVAAAANVVLPAQPIFFSLKRFFNV